MSRLAGIAAFASLSALDLGQLDRAATWRRYRRGEQILGRDSACRDVYFVVEGQVDVVNYSVSGREIAYGTLSAGSFFGELSAIDGEPRSAAVVADTDCLLAWMPPRTFQTLLRQHPDVAMHVLNQLARVVRSCDERIMDLATLGAVQRVEQEVLRMARQDPATPGLWSVYPVPTQQDIARRAATTRETVARVLSLLEQQGMIHRKGKTLYLRDRCRLERCIERLNPAE
ncbi:MAG: Crp/Fnr family transcriptional regulator [Proteobacteria bacterium]|nr:Crp/Fnr family transcriptional regulator [Pseudomonadota bacterium]MBI3496942.1 Crp/Fnr family transcriptional regulator [Pseudomonadota bacterium]